jgi:SAM-dependent methyltransferase
VTRDYLYGGEFAEERQRLAGIESLWDAGTQALMDELGIAEGWHCLEAGAGGGSIVEWMAGRGATVVAVDIDTWFIDRLASDKVEVRQLDLRVDALPESQFDLVHARLVLEHLPDRRQILDRMAAALRRGGWLLIEDYDWADFGFEGNDPQAERLGQAILTLMQEAGFEARYGRRLVNEIADAGLVDVRGEGRARVIDSSSPGFDFFRLSFESLRDTLVDGGRITAEEADAAAARFGEQIRVITPLLMAGIGRRP